MIALEANGERRPLAQWGIRDAVLETASQWQDTLRVSMRVASISDPLPWAYGAQISLWIDEVCHFRGQVTELPALGDASGEGATYVISGPWWLLERALYQQTRTVRSQVGDEPHVVEQGGGVYSSRVVLAGHPSTASVGAQCMAAVAYATGIYSLPIQLGTMDVDTQPPVEEALDVTCAEVIRRMLRWAPDAVTWWDYSSSRPRLHIRRRAALTARTVDLDAADQVGSVSVQPRHDLQVPGVHLMWEEREEVTEEDQTTVYVRIRHQRAGDYSGLGAVVHTFQSARAEAPATLAMQYWTALNQLHYDGEIELKEREITRTIGVGHRLRLTSGQAAWATMDALIQTATYDLVSGESRITFGPPAHLAPQDFLALMSRRQKEPRAADSDFPDTASTGVYPGPGGGIGPGGIDSGLSNTVEIEYCDGGVVKRLRVYGSIVAEEEEP